MQIVGVPGEAEIVELLDIVGGNEADLAVSVLHLPPVVLCMQSN